MSKTRDDRKRNARAKTYLNDYGWRIPTSGREWRHWMRSLGSGTW